MNCTKYTEKVSLARAHGAWPSMRRIVLRKWYVTYPAGYINGYEQKTEENGIE
jgi:hypothetical protein